jgi:hypothetical protein
LHLDFLHLLPRLVLLLVQILEQVFLPLDLSVDVADSFLNVSLCLGKILLDQGRPDKLVNFAIVCGKVQLFFYLNWAKI